MALDGSSFCLKNSVFGSYWKKPRLILFYHSFVIFVAMPEIILCMRLSKLDNKAGTSNFFELRAIFTF